MPNCELSVDIGRDEQTGRRTSAAKSNFHEGGWVDTLKSHRFVELAPYDCNGTDQDLYTGCQSDSVSSMN